MIGNKPFAVGLLRVIAVTYSLLRIRNHSHFIPLAFIFMNIDYERNRII